MNAPLVNNYIRNSTRQYKHKYKHRYAHLLLPVAMLWWGMAAPAFSQANTALTIRADIQEANSRTGVVTARGNVRMKYPARQINATSTQAQYFSKERRIVLSGNVIVLQQGNSIKAETITYLIDEGKFQALPPNEQQVESVYIVPDDGATSSAASTTPVAQIKPAFKNPSKNLISPINVPTNPQQDTTTEPTKEPAKPETDRKSQEVENSSQPQPK